MPCLVLAITGACNGSNDEGGGTSSDDGTERVSRLLPTDAGDGAERASALTPSGASDGTERASRLIPTDADDTEWLEELAVEELADLEDAKVIHDFRFRDVSADSGITFVHRIVDDAGRAYKAVHYDHGNGVAVADVDGDGSLDLYFVNQAGPNQLAVGNGDGTFTDVTSTSNTALDDRIKSSATFADIDNDGDPDLFVTSVRGGNVLFENIGDRVFRDITDSAGVGYVGHSSAAVFFDYDRDGLLDLLVVNVGEHTTDVRSSDPPYYYLGHTDAFGGHLYPERSEASVLYHNDGGNTFSDVSRDMGFVDDSWSGDAVVLDGNADGWPDVYLLNMQGNDRYYENAGGKEFVERSAEVFPRTPWGSMGAKPFDADNDGSIDLFVTDMHSDMSQDVAPRDENRKSDVVWPEDFRGRDAGSVWGNALFLDRDEFVERSDALGLENYWPWGPSVADLNADGFDDVFITAGMNYPYRYARNSVRLNNAGAGFLEAASALGVEPRAGGLTTPWFILDASGSDRNHADATGLVGDVEIWAARASRSAAIFDIDGDGDLDVVTNEFNAAPMVLVSDLAEHHDVRFLAVSLVGTTSNRDGLGAEVTVIAGRSSYTKVFDGASGYLSHSLIPLYFGLGDAETVDRVEVRWPSGTTQVLDKPIAANTTLTLVEEQSEDQDAQPATTVDAPPTTDGHAGHD
jgi:enediyne biosynthesis protein E4